MVGHSGVTVDRHLACLAALRGLPPERLHLFFPFVPDEGNPYLSEVKSFANSRFPHTHYLRRRLTAAEFSEYMASMDICLFDAADSEGVGTARIALECRKSLYLNASGYLRRVLDEQNLPYRTVEEIPEMDFTAFAAPSSYPPDTSARLREAFGTDDPVAAWHSFLGN